MLFGKDRQIANLIARYGIQNGQAAIEAEQQEYRPTLARCLAMLENESGGQNIFGGEGTALPYAWYETEVTQEKYLVYLKRRNEGMSPDGVGPCQLTVDFLQDAADKKGGCWIPKHNMEVGFAYLHAMILEGGVWWGFAAYNGGPGFKESIEGSTAAEEYADRALARANLWERRLDTIR